MSANHILIKQLNKLTKNELPNIKVNLNDDMTKLDVTFYYKKSSPNDTFPYFFPKEYDEDILISGQIELNDFPNKPPKLILYGDLAHCHVHPYLEHYVICFSLDESYQWFFGSKHMKSSKFNPSVSIRYYLIAVYKFLAEDDREYEVGDERRTKSFILWKNQIPTLKPTVMIPYYESLQLMNTDADTDTNNKLDNMGIDHYKNGIMEKYNILTEIPNSVIDLKDFVDKELLLLTQEPLLFCINYMKLGDRHIFKVASMDLMKDSTFKAGIKQTSLGIDFNAGFPLVIHSKIWEKTNSKMVLDELTNKIFGNIKVNQIIKLYDKVEQFDHHLYIISELFNELAIDVFSESMFPCEEVLKGFIHLHHLLLVLEKDNPLIGHRQEKILDYFESNIMNRDKKVCPNIGILMTQYLVSKHKRNIEYLVDELLTRNVLWSLKKPNECIDCIGFNPNKKEFSITNMDKWIEVTWNNSYVGMQRFAFQQLYNNKFSGETLDSMDKRFGQVNQEEIELFQREVKQLCSWKILNGKAGYKAFFEYFGLNHVYIENKLINALNNSTKFGYHQFVITKEWKYSLDKITIKNGNGNGNMNGNRYRKF